jgi:hypothetical protein
MMTRRIKFSRADRSAVIVPEVVYGEEPPKAERPPEIKRMPADPSRKIDIVTVVFGHEGGINPNPKFKRLLHAWSLSCAKSNPDARIVVVETDRPPTSQGMKPSYSDNTHKLHLWRDYLRDKAEGDSVFLDCDMIIQRDLREGFAELGGNWDAAWTRRKARDYINGGTVFCRKNAGGLAFLDKWCEINDYIFEDKKRVEQHLALHCGLNQTSLHKMISQRMIPPESRVVDLPCVKYNCCDQHWHEFSNNVAVLHVKSALQRYCLGRQPMTSVLSRWKAAVQAYRLYDPATTELEFPQDKIELIRM